MPDERLDQIVEYLNNIKSDDFTLEVKGGEPFVTDQFLKFIDRLTDEFKQKTTLVIFSNGTGISDYYIEKLKPFKLIRCNLSIEATGNLYNYIRGGEKHNMDNAVDFMTKMVKSLNNFRPGISVTVTMYNIFDLPNLLAEIKKYLGKQGWNDFSKAFGSFSYYPTYQDPANLPEVTKKQLIEKYSKEPSFVQVVKYLKTRKRDRKKWKKFKEFTLALDELRNENLFDVAPEFREIWNEE
jgi:organic radical activating enzyme